MKVWDRYTVVCVVCTVMVNILSLGVLLFYQRRKYRNIKIVLFNLFLIHILFSVNQITAVSFNRNIAAESINSNSTGETIAGSTDVAAFLILVYSLNLDILALQCAVNATRSLKEALDTRKLQNLSVVSVLVCWLVPIIIALPLILLQVNKNGTPDSEENSQLRIYLQAVLLIALFNLTLALAVNVYVAFRTWIKVNPKNIIDFTVNRKNVAMTILTAILYSVSSVPYISAHLAGGDRMGRFLVNVGIVNTTFWIDKLGVPIAFFVIYHAKNLCQVLYRLIRGNKRQRQVLREKISKHNNNNNIRAINSFTHVQHVAEEVIDGGKPTPQSQPKQIEHDICCGDVENITPRAEQQEQSKYVLSMSTSNDCIQLDLDETQCSYV